jgi:hypothetical protein
VFAPLGRVQAVKTLTRPPQTPVRPRAVAEAPRRWPRRLAAGVVLLAVMIAAVAGVWIANIEPLAMGHVSYAISGRGLHVTQRTVDALGVAGTVQTRAMRPDMTFRYRFSVTNTGRLSVTIVDAGADTPRGISTKVVAADPSVPAAAPSGGFGPFTPITLSPGQTATLTMQVHVAPDACSLAGSSAAWHTEPITYRVLGVTRHAEIATGTEIRLERTGATSC